MKYLSFLTMLSLVFFLSCSQKETSVQPTLGKSIEGSWQGTLNGASFEITFIEGEFEGEPSVTGSANFIGKNESSSYLVMNGTKVSGNKVIFALYKVPVVSKEDYHIEGTISGTTINGIYKKLSQNGKVIETGAWRVKRLP